MAYFITAYRFMFVLLYSVLLYHNILLDILLCYMKIACYFEFHDITSYLIRLQYIDVYHFEFLYHTKLEPMMLNYIMLYGIAFY